MDRRYIRHALPVNKFDESTNASASALATTFRHIDTLLQAMRFFLSWFDRVFVERTREEKNRRFLNRSFPSLYSRTCAFYRVFLKFYGGIGAKWKAQSGQRNAVSLGCSDISVAHHSRSTTPRPPLRTRQRQSAQPESFNTLRDRLSAKA